MMIRFVLGAICATALSAQVSMIEAQGEARKYWSQWRGPSGQGIVESGDYPDTWSATENVRWKIEVPGLGYSSPIVWKDRIFVTTAYDGTKRVIQCYKRDDGKLLWETPAPSATAEHLYKKNSYATATPVTD